MPTEQQRREVLTLTGYGARQDEIATLLNIDPKTLRKAFRRELDTGAIEANARVAASLYSLAVKERNLGACIWWTKARMGWRGVGDPAADMPLQVEFSWRDTPVESPGIKPSHEVPIIDAAATDGDDGAVVVWQGED